MEGSSLRANYGFGYILLRDFRDETTMFLLNMSLRAGGFDGSVKSLSFFNSFMKTFTDNIFRIVNFVNII